MVGNLMNHRDPNLVDQLLVGRRYRTERQPVQRDPIRKNESAVIGSFGEWHPFVEAKKILVGVEVVNHDHDVVHYFTQRLRKAIKSLSHQALERAAGHRIHSSNLPQRRATGFWTRELDKVSLWPPVSLIPTSCWRT